jgi:Fur family transcriptional regulator, ferric uptake regulator
MSVLTAQPSAGHLNAHDIVTRLAQRDQYVDLATAYRNIGDAVEIGVLHALTVGERVTYGLTHQPHHHAVCTSCGTVIRSPRRTT